MTKTKTKIKTKTKTATTKRASKPAVRFDVYQTVTDTLIRLLESGVNPWRKDWTGTSRRGVPFPTRSTGEHYRGINILLLWAAAMEHGFQSAHWFTYRQASELGGQVRKGERSSLVVKYGEIIKEVDGEDQKIPYLKAYRVFNADQIDGLSEKFAVEKEEPKDLGTKGDPVLDGKFAAIGATIESSDEPSAYYRSANDTVHMPPIATFTSAEGYYTTLAHELVHWSGHKTRLDRKPAAEHAYAFEELIAEIGACFVCAQLGVEIDYPNAAGYLDGFLKVMRSDKRAIVRASSAAQSASDFLLAKMGTFSRPIRFDNAKGRAKRPALPSPSWLRFFQTGAPEKTALATLATCFEKQKILPIRKWTGFRNNSVGGHRHPCLYRPDTVGDIILLLKWMRSRQEPERTFQRAVGEALAN